METSSQIWRKWMDTGFGVLEDSPHIWKVLPLIHIWFITKHDNTTLSLLQTSSSRLNSMKCQESVSGKGRSKKSENPGCSSAQDDKGFTQGLKRKRVIPLVSPNANLGTINLPGRRIFPHPIKIFKQLFSSTYPHSRSTLSKRYLLWNQLKIIIIIPVVGVWSVARNVM